LITSINILDFLENQPFSPSLLLFAYQTGWFPMADDESNEIYWHSPVRRAIFPLHSDGPKFALKKAYAKSGWSFAINTAFSEVIQHCANREDTWISQDIITVYSDLHDQGYAHSIETYDNGNLIGGLYGVSIGSAFFGESMFSLQSNASKMAFVHLYRHLIQQGFTLLDSQYINDHTLSLGAITISRTQYLEMLSQAVQNQDISFSTTNLTTL
jgi:leucyl/phenylalanyl-tRNA--protein transferase